PGVAGRAVWHANWLSIIDGRLVVGIVKRIGPNGRTICGGCHSYREQTTNDHRRDQRGNKPHFQSLLRAARYGGRASKVIYEYAPSTSTNSNVEAGKPLPSAGSAQPNRGLTTP